jgi:hypothetical protein
MKITLAQEAMKDPFMVSLHPAEACGPSNTTDVSANSTRSCTNPEHYFQNCRAFDRFRLIIWKTARLA